jgi:hypothetical protein
MTDTKPTHKQGCDALGGYGQGIGACSCGADTKPTLEEQMRWLKQAAAGGDVVPPPGYKTMCDSLLAILKELAAIRNQPVPVEPEIYWIPIEDGTHPMVDLQDYRNLQSALQVAQQERDEAVNILKAERIRPKGKSVAMYMLRATEADASNKRLVELVIRVIGSMKEYNAELAMYYDELLREVGK